MLGLKNTIVSSAIHTYKIVFYFALFILLNTAKINKKGKNKENRVLHVVRKEEVRSDHSSKCFRDDHYHMISRERKLLVIS